MPSIGKSKNRDEGPAKVTLLSADPEGGEVVARVLESAGHAVRRAFENDATLAAITSDLPALVVVDLGGGASNPGLRIVEGVRSHPNESVRSLRLVLLSSQPGSEGLAWSAGIDGLLSRPVHAEDLTRVVAEVLARPEKQRATFRSQALQAL